MSGEHDQQRSVLEASTLQDRISPWLRAMNLWPRSPGGAALSAALVVAVGTALGLALFHWAAAVVVQALFWVLNVALTYYFVNRALRRRERSVDEILLTTVASVRRRVRGLVRRYVEPRAEETRILESYDRGVPSHERFAVGRNELAAWLQGHMQSGRDLEIALDKTDRIRSSIEGALHLAGSATPKLGAPMLELAFAVEGSSRSVVEDLRVSMVGWDQLVLLASIGQGGGDAKAEISRALCDFARGLSAITDDLMDFCGEFLWEDLPRFESSLPPRLGAFLAREYAGRDADDAEDNHDDTQRALDRLRRREAADQPEGAGQG